MKNHLLILGGLCALGLALASQTHAAPLYAHLPSAKVIPIVSQTTTQPVTINPILKLNTPHLVVDPSLQAIPPSQATSTPTPLPIDPSKLGGMQIIPITPVVIPPALLKGPDITDIIASSDINSLRIQWTTSKPATTLVDYGLTDSYGKTLSDKTLVTAHDVLLAAQPGQTMHVQLTSADSLKRKTSTSDVAIVIPPVAQPPTATSTGEAQPPSQMPPTSTQVQPEGQQPPVVAQEQSASNQQPASTDQSDNSTLIAVLIGVVAILAIIVIVMLVKKSKKGPEPKA